MKLTTTRNTRTCEVLWKQMNVSLLKPVLRTQHSNTGCHIIYTARGTHTTRIPAFTWLHIKPAWASAGLQASYDRCWFDLCLGDEMGDKWCKWVRTLVRSVARFGAVFCFAGLNGKDTNSNLCWKKQPRKKEIHTRSTWWRWYKVQYKLKWLFVSL